MPKQHTRRKRALRTGSTSRKHRFWFTRVEKKSGPRSFASREAAESWAKEQKLSNDLVLHETPTGKFQWREAPRV